MDKLLILLFSILTCLQLGSSAERREPDSQLIKWVTSYEYEPISNKYLCWKTPHKVKFYKSNYENIELTSYNSDSPIISNKRRLIYENFYIDKVKMTLHEATLDNSRYLIATKSDVEGHRLTHNYFEITIKCRKEQNSLALNAFSKIELKRHEKKLSPEIIEEFKIKVPEKKSRDPAQGAKGQSQP